MNNSPRVEASLTTRAQVWFQALPLVTKAVLVLCLLLSALSLLTGFDLAHPACLNAHLVVERLQLYRILTAVVVHSGVLHVTFNMLAFTPLASALERQLGSVQLLYFLFVFLLLGDSFFIACAYTAHWTFNTGLSACAVGLSGVIFALVVVETHLSGAQQRSIFGFFTVRAAYFPWALLLLWQLLLPHVSFFGHLGGILAGQMYVWGWLKLLVPSSSALQAVEQAFPMRRCIHLDSFICHNGGSPLPTSANSSDSGPPLPFTASAGTQWMRRSFGGWLPIEGSAGQAAASDKAVGIAEDSKKGHVLGGVTSPAAAGPPSRAAATAAEARALRGSPAAIQQQQQSQREKPFRERDKRDPEKPLEGRLLPSAACGESAKFKTQENKFAWAERATPAVGL